MNNNALVLYNLLNENFENVNRVLGLKEEKFLKSEDCLNYGYGLILKIRELFINMNKEILFSNNYLNKVSKEMYILDEKLLNYHNQINGYLVYDFLNSEYKLIFEEMSKVLKI